MISKKTLLIFLAATATLFLIIHFVILNTYFTIATGDSGSGRITVSYLDSNGSSPQVSSVFGVYMIPRSSDVITIKQGSQETRKFIHSKLPIGFNHLQVALKPQKQVTKLGQNGLGCNGKTASERYFSYSCFNATDNVFMYANKKAGQYENQQVITEAPDTRLVTKPYKNGLLSIVLLSDALHLQYLDATTGSVQTIVLKDTETDSMNLYVDSSSESFVLVDNPNNQMTFYKSLIDIPRHFKISEDIVYTSCSVLRSSVLCATASKEVVPANEEGAHSAANAELIKDSRLLHYDITTSKQSSYHTERLVDEVCLTNDGVYSLEDDEKLYFYPKNSNSQSLIGAGIISIACGDNLIAYTDGVSIFSTRNGDAELMFTEERLVVSTIQVLSGDIVFTSFLDGEPQQTLLAYKVTGSAVQPQRIEAILPYTTDDELPVFEMDYDDKNIYIKPQLSVISDRQAGKMIVNEEALANTKREIEAKLSKDKLLNKYSLIYYY